MIIGRNRRLLATFIFVCIISVQQQKIKAPTTPIATHKKSIIIANLTDNGGESFLVAGHMIAIIGSKNIENTDATVAKITAANDMFIAFSSFV